MTKKLTRLALLLCLAAIVYIAGFLVGQRDGMGKHAIEEARICTANLDFHTNNLSPQTQEYMKARLYWNCSQYIPSKDYALDHDYGPVDLTNLGGLCAAKDPTGGYATLYEQSKVKHLKQRGPNTPPDRTR